LGTAHSRHPKSYLMKYNKDLVIRFDIFHFSPALKKLIEVVERHKTKTTIVAFVIGQRPKSIFLATEKHFSLMVL